MDQSQTGSSSPHVFVEEEEENEELEEVKEHC